MSFYAGTIILTELLMIAMAVHVQNHKGFTRQQKFWFLLSFYSVMVCAIAEFLAIRSHAYGPASVPLLTMITVIQFSLAPLLPVFFAGALGMNQLAKKVAPVFATHVLVEIVLAPYGAIFYFDSHGKYFHGEYYVIYEIFYLISMVFLIISLFIVGRRFQSRDVTTIIMVFVVIAASIIMLVFFDLHINYIGIAISASLCYIYYNDLVQHDIQAEVKANQMRISNIQKHIILELANLIENRDLETGEHVARTSEDVGKLARAARRDGVYADVLDDRYINMLTELAPLHDIGKIVVPDRILRKEGRLTPDEFEQMKLHTSAGGRIVRDILEGIAGEEHIRFAADIAMYHHEWWDGTGYPRGLKEEEIPLAARIMAIADVYDALVSERYYKKAMPADEALEIIRREAGMHFDPLLAEVFLKHQEEITKAGEEG